MPLSNPFRRLADRPSLRERAATLRADLSQPRPQPASLPAPGSEEAVAAYRAACREETIRSQAIVEGYPDLRRGPSEWWTADDLGKAMEAGEITPVECARLYPLATERELRLAEIAHELNLGARHALAFADSYPLPPDAHGEAVPSDLADACLWASKHRDWIDDVARRAPMSDEETEAELKKVDAVVTRAIEEPSASLRDLAAKAALALEDYTRFTVNLARKPDDGIRIVQTVLREAAAVAPESASAERAAWGPDGLTSAILDGWAAWGATPCSLEANAEEEAAWEREDARRDALLRAVMALPATAENIAPKALACAWMEWVAIERPGQPREAYGPADRLVFDINATIMARGSQETTSRPAPPALDFGPDAHIAELAAEFCQAYARNAVADRAMMAGTLSEEEWEPHYRAAVALMDRLEATEPKTLLGMALKGLGPIGAGAWNVPREGDKSRLSQWERLGEQFEAALMAGKLAPFTSDSPDLVGLIDLTSATMDELRAVHQVALLVGGISDAIAWQGRCNRERDPSGGAKFNAAGTLMHRLGDALSNVSTAAEDEARRRTGDVAERNTRLQILALQVLENGDPDETAAFARELLAMVDG